MSMHKHGYRRGLHGRGPNYRNGRHGRARRWLHENPAPEEVIGFLEEYQRDLEQQVADVAERIKQIRETIEV